MACPPAAGAKARVAGWQTHPICPCLRVALSMVWEPHDRLSPSEVAAAQRSTAAFLGETSWTAVRKARLQLALWASLALFCVLVTFSPLRSGYTEGPRFDAPTDIDLYNAEIDRMRQGEG